MTMDFTVLELVLIVWAVVATAWWWEARHNLHMTRFVFTKILEDKEVRDKMVREFEEHQKGTA
jgi:uncharacterized ion transporter superfamily protein YfcC